MPKSRPVPFTARSRDVSPYQQARRLGPSAAVAPGLAGTRLALLVLVAGLCAVWIFAGLAAATARVLADEPPAQASTSQTASPIGRRIDDLTLNDHLGQSHALADLKERKLVVLAFLGTECPLVQLYGGRLGELAEQFEPQGVTFWGINSNSQDSITEIAAYARRHGITFPILKDQGNRIADQVGAKRTPEVFVLDGQRVVRYHGRIDDQFGIGYQRDEPDRADLRLALEELLAGRPVSVAETEVTGCLIGRVRQPRTDSPVTYSGQIAAILQERCVECHRKGEIAPFALTEYDEVVGWADMIDEVVQERRMPPWHASPEHGKFRDDRRLSDEQRHLIHQWVLAGAPEGDRGQLPEPPQFVDGWQLPREPDLVVDGQEMRIPARGEVPYRWYSVDPGFQEDKWIQAAELRPGNRAVVHHILVFAREPGSSQRGGARGFLVGYVPGLRVEPYPPGMAKRIPAGSQLVFQVHYTPIGSEQLDRSQLGLVFADPDKLTHEVTTTSAVQPLLRIPPHAANYKATATTRNSVESGLLLSMMPHMHLRGKSFRYEALLPDGTSEILLDIPHYDFNWQTSYRLAEPREFPAGTRIHCTAHYDNSEDNLNNPDPGKEVRWGDQTWEEMMIGYFDLAVAKDASRAPAVGGLLPRNIPVRVRAAQLIKRYDKNGDQIVERGEVPAALTRVFGRLDQNADGKLDLDELSEGLDKLR
jgi:peroxiredoxin/mono/diheme cytochrome c family protein